jgi:PAS domain S-box-containing protein
MPEALHHAMAVAGVGTFDLDLETGQVSCDARGREILGLTAGSVPYEQALASIVHPEDVAAVRDALRAALDPSGSGVLRVAFRTVAPDWSVRSVLATGAAVFGRRGGDGGRALRLVGTVVDETERRRAEDALRESEARFRDLANTISQLAWMADAEGSVFWYNERWFDYTGLSLEECRGWGWRRAHHPDHVERVVERLAVCYETGEPWQDTFPLRARDGRYRWFLSRAVPIRDDRGRVTRWFGTSTDVTAELESERQVKAAARQLREALEAARMGTFDFDVDSGRIAWDERSLALFGAPPGETRSIAAGLRIVHPDDVARVKAEVAAALDPRTGGRFESEYRFVLPTGEVRWVSSRGQVRFEGEGEARRARRLIGTHVDVTERRRADEALREADRRKSEFLGVLSHELRNPLAPIRSSVYVLDRAAPGSPQARHAREVIERQVTHLTRLVDDLLDVTRISRGKVRLRRERLLLGELVRRTVEDYGAEFARRGVGLRLDAPAVELPVEGDPTRLAQVVGNLLQNAAKFTPAGGRAEVVVLGAEPCWAELRVRDTGPGIPPEMLPRIFEPFAQGDATLDRSKGGLGLGLALVKGLVELHGGSVSAQARVDGAGAQVVVRLPLAAAPRAGEPRDRPSPTRAARRVLLVEDNADAADSLREALELNGHEVTVARTGPEGLEAARGRAPDVVLCDIGLPGLDGFEVARAVRADPALSSLTLVALTGYALAEDVERAREAGFDRHLVKPVEIETLEQVLSGAEAAGATRDAR